MMEMNYKLEVKPDCYGNYGCEECILEECNFNIDCGNNKWEINLLDEGRRALADEED